MHTKLFQGGAAVYFPFSSLLHKHGRPVWLKHPQNRMGRQLVCMQCMFDRRIHFFGISGICLL